MSNTVAFTICSANYLSRALVLIKSIAEHHPEIERAIFLCDRKSDAVEELIHARDEGVTIYWFDEVPLQFPLQQAFQYDIMEFNTAIKPACFKFLIEKKNATTVIYIDPDIKLYAPMTDCLDALSNGWNMVVTPHITAPIDSIANPNEVSFMSSGIYNFGFFAVNAAPSTLKMLNWWEKRLEGECVVDRTKGYFVDQKWMNILHSAFDDVYILRHQGYNTAYWNLMQRELNCARDGRITSGGADLVFFHFSGLDPKDDTRLSRHENRYDVSQMPLLKQLIQEYIEDVNQNFHQEFTSTAYAFNTFADGRPISKYMRIYFRSSAEARAAGGADPFATLSTFFDTLEPRCSRPGHPLVSRLLWQIWHSRRDLSALWNIEEPAECKKLCDWFAATQDSKDWDQKSAMANSRLFMERSA